MVAPIVFVDVAGPDPLALRNFYPGPFGWGIDEHPAIETGGLRGTLKLLPPRKIML